MRQSIEISIYTGQLTTQGWINGISKIKKSFPSLPKDFYEILLDRIKIHGFSDERFLDAIDHVIDTCKFPMPTIASFIDFDEKIKIINYEEMIEKVHEIGDTFNRIYTWIDYNGSSAWIRNDDFAKYKKIILNTK